MKHEASSFIRIETLSGLMFIEEFNLGYNDLLVEFGAKYLEKMEEIKNLNEKMKDLEDRFDIQINYDGYKMTMNKKRH